MASAAPPPALSRKAIARLLAVFLVSAALGYAGYELRGDANPDWAGYEEIYGGQGAWLADLGRDPLFTWMMAGAAELFGRHGYEDFRLALTVLFVLAGAAIALRLPGQRFHVMTVSAGVVALLLTKSTVQIREGLAFLLIAAAVFRIVRAAPRLPTYGLLLAAALTHFGAAPYLVVYALAHGLSLVAWRPRAVALGAVAVVLALVLARFLADSAFARNAVLEEALTQIGAGGSADVTSSGLKYLYWAAYGGVLFVLGRQAMRAAANTFTMAHVAMLMPFLYALAVYSIIAGLPGLAVSMAGRALSTAAGVALLIVLLRKQANPWTIAASTFLIVDQVRTIQAAIA